MSTTFTNISKSILIDELLENSHIENVEDVIFWALEHYAKCKETKGALVANSIVQRIEGDELEGKANLMNYDAIESLNL